MRRSHFLRLSSFLMMLTALVRAFFGIMMINLFAMAKNMGTSDPSTVRMAGIAFGLLMAGAAADLICGFVGALNWEEPLLAGRCIAWGTVALLLGLAGNFAQSFTGYGVSYVAWTTGLIIPLAYLISAVHFKLMQKK